ncbi:MAG: carbohydrate ABC transporter permease [Chloroflexi bacterium]|nr:carbohydrate ABC transporter permease [Chloroflexota bacterium]
MEISAGKITTFFKNFVLYLSLSAGMILVLAPFYWVFITSVKLPEETIAYPVIWIPSKITWEHFQAVWHAKFLIYYRNSIIVAVPVVLGTLFTSSLAGFIFAKFDFPGKEPLFFLTLSTMMVPFAVLLIPTYLLIAKLKWVNTYWALIIPFLVNGFNIYLMRQFITDIPDELLDAAEIDGCSNFGAYWRIIIPLCKPAMSALAIFQFILTWNNFLWPLIATSTEETRTLPVGLALFIFRYWRQYNQVMAGSVIVVVPLVIFYFIFQQTFIEGIAMTGIKH